MITAIPYIDRVTNPASGEGGTDQESYSDFMNRAVSSIHHQKRAVCAEDIETLVYEAVAGVARVKCLGNFRPDRVYEQGWVTVVIVLDEGGEKPVPGAESIRTIALYLQDRCSAVMVNGIARFNPPGYDASLSELPFFKDNEGMFPIRLDNITVIPPNYIQVRVEADIMLEDTFDSGSVLDRVNKRLSSFLHVLHGGQEGKGWDFGRDVYASEVYKIMFDIDGIKEIPNS